MLETQHHWKGLIPMTAIYIGSAFLATSIALELGPQVFADRWQYGLKVFCAAVAICVLFHRRPNQFVESSKAREACIGFSLVIPAFVAWLAYNNLMALPLGIDTNGLYSFLLWAVFAIAAVPIWGQLLFGIGLISREERESLRTFRRAK